MEALSGYEMDRLTKAFDCTLKCWDKPHMMPPIAYIVNHLPVPADSDEDLRLQAELIQRQQERQGRAITMEQAMDIARVL